MEPAVLVLLLLCPKLGPDGPGLGSYRHADRFVSSSKAPRAEAAEPKA